ncbi:MAG: hypothetical protein ACKV0T_28115 [Planctomycetales bacterium]
MPQTPTLAVEQPALSGEPVGGFSEEVLSIADRFGVRHLLPRLYGEIQALFPEPIEVEVEWDPEISDSPKIVFDVVTDLDRQQRLKREQIWITRILDLAGADSLLFVFTAYPHA